MSNSDVQSQKSDDETTRRGEIKATKNFNKSGNDSNLNNITDEPKEKLSMMEILKEKHILSKGEFTRTPSTASDKSESVDDKSNLNINDAENSNPCEDITQVTTENKNENPAIGFVDSAFPTLRSLQGSKTRHTRRVAKSIANVIQENQIQSNFQQTMPMVQPMLVSNGPQPGMMAYMPTMNFNSPNPFVQQLPGVMLQHVPVNTINGGIAMPMQTIALTHHALQQSQTPLEHLVAAKKEPSTDSHSSARQKRSSGSDGAVSSKRVRLTSKARIEMAAAAGKCVHAGCQIRKDGPLDQAPDSKFCRRHLCSFAGCVSAARSKKLCSAHGGGKRCQVDSCEKSAQGATPFCKSHGGGKRCEYPMCQTSARGNSSFCTQHSRPAMNYVMPGGVVVLPNGMNAAVPMPMQTGLPQALGISTFPMNPTLTHSVLSQPPP